MFDLIYSSQKFYDIGAAIILFNRRRSGDLEWLRHLLNFTESVRAKARF